MMTPYINGQPVHGKPKTTMTTHEAIQTTKTSTDMSSVLHALQWLEANDPEALADDVETSDLPTVGRPPKDPDGAHIWAWNEEDDEVICCDASWAEAFVASYEEVRASW